VVTLLKIKKALSFPTIGAGFYICFSSFQIQMPIIYRTFRPLPLEEKVPAVTTQRNPPRNRSLAGTPEQAVGLVIGSDRLLSEAIVAAIRTPEHPIAPASVEDAIGHLRRGGIRVIVLLPNGVDVAELIPAAQEAGDVRLVIASASTQGPAPQVADVDVVLATTFQEVVQRVNKVLVLSPSVVTERSKQILQRLAKGDSPAEAARFLGIKVGTLSNQLSVIYEQMGVRNATEAVLAALRSGLIQL
jgi:DNA-binding CsgD family transcriptional regulator